MAIVIKKRVGQTLDVSVDYKVNSTQWK